MKNAKGLIIAFAVAAVALAAGFVAWTSTPGGAADSSADVIFLSTDEGKTYFSGPAAEPPPVTVNGKSAMQAFVFRGAADSQPFVGYLLRYTDRGKEIAKKMKTQSADTPHAAMPSMELMNEIQIKRPADKTWVKQSDIASASTIMAVRSKADPSKPAELVSPLPGIGSQITN